MLQFGESRSFFSELYKSKAFRQTGVAVNLIISPLAFNEFRISPLVIPQI